jgi:hypothetical protein
VVPMVLVYPDTVQPGGNPAVAYSRPLPMWHTTKCTCVVILLFISASVIRDTSIQLAQSHGCIHLPSHSSHLHVHVSSMVTFGIPSCISPCTAPITTIRYGLRYFDHLTNNIHERPNLTSFDTTGTALSMRVRSQGTPR